MPRNAAKKTNKNAKRLPVLIKLTNNNKRKKKNKSNKNHNNKNTTIKKISKPKKKHQNSKNINNNNNIKKAVKLTTFENKFNLTNDNNCSVNITTTSVKESTTATKTPTKNTNQTIHSENFSHQQEEEQQPEKQQIEQESNFKYLKKSVKNSYSNDKSDTKEDLTCVTKNNNNDKDNIFHCTSGSSSNSVCNDICKTDSATLNFTLTTTFTSSSILPLSSTTALTTLTTSSSSSATLSPPSTSASSPSTSVLSCTSSLYPIVIETTESFQQQQEEENDLNKTSSASSLTTNTHSNNNNNNNNKNITCHTAVDTLKYQQQQQQQQKKSQNNNNNNKIVATTAKRNNKQQAATTTLSKTLEHQSQEVKARLATLRSRKVFPTSDKAQKGHKTTSAATTTTSASSSDDQKQEENNSNDEKTAPAEDKSSTTIGIQFLKRAVPVVLDEETLNRIETLSDNAVKKPTTKRKRNQTAVLLSLNALQQPRSKRFVATPAAAVAVDKQQQQQQQSLISSSAVAAPVAVQDKKQLGNFLKPLPVETSTTNTNSKKRARIMSLYERPYQTTANDGGGRSSVVGNGYMTSGRSSAVGSSGVAGGGVVIMNDTNDTQEMASQYYLAGTSGSGGIAGNSSNPPIVGNGSAINHAPTMGTLCNIGNTCYLNSVVYTLRFAPQFLHNLHHLLADLNALQQNIARARAKSSSLGRGISAVHMENARSWSSKDLASMEQYATTAGTTGVAAAAATVSLGPGVAGSSAITASNSTALTQVTQKSCHQLLTEKLHELYQSLYRNEISESTEPHHADTLLHAIQDVSSIFEGNQQQDAHEFLMCLLNSIRETSQTLIKAIAECPDVILNGYISNPDEMERDLIKNTSIGGGGIGSSNNSNSLASSALSSLTSSSKTSSFFSRKSKRKDETKNSKNSRLQSPLKEALMSGGNNTTTASNSLFYLNTNDLNSTSPPAIGSATSTTLLGGGTSAAMTSPSNSSGGGAAGDDMDPPTAVALLLKDKQRLEGKIRELGLDFFNEDFEGITVSTTKCLSCETITEQKETMIDIAVPVPQAGYESNEFTDRPSSFIQNSCITREYFRNENKYRCEQCCGYTEAIRSISYEILPRLLIIQLSRFSGGMEKINSYIPTSFTLQCFCSKCCELSDANKLHIYKLYSVITHVGATMSVGHYIAYTCSLDWANEYINCPKEQRRRASQERSVVGASGNGSTAGMSAVGGNNQSSTSSLGSTTSNSFMKMKMKFGRSKASSSGDMSKNVKHINGLTTASSKAITNGIGKLTMNSTGGTAAAAAVTPPCPITCQSINCCAMRLTAQQQLQYQSANNSTSDFSEESSNGSAAGYTTTPAAAAAAAANYNNNLHHHQYNTSTTNTSGYGSTGRGSTKASYATTQNNCSEPIWYMCDDDKIKAMTQREFEELLSPARKITITPYLLFYARYNLQSTPPKSSSNVSSSSPGPMTSSSPQTSWSNESLQSSGHSGHSSGMRM